MTPQPENQAQDDVAVVRLYLPLDQAHPAHYHLDRLAERIAQLERERDERPFIGGASLTNERAEAAEARADAYEEALGGIAGLGEYATDNYISTDHADLRTVRDIVAIARRALDQAND